MPVRESFKHRLDREVSAHINIGVGFKRHLFLQALETAQAPNTTWT